MRDKNMSTSIDEQAAYAQVTDEMERGIIGRPSLLLVGGDGE